jgi:hypothetical protein
VEATKELVNVLREVNSIGGETLNLCAPRRHALKPLHELRRLMLGSLYEPILSACRSEIAPSVARASFMTSPSLAAAMERLRMDESTFTSNYVILKHIDAKAPIFTVSPALHLMLEDTGVKDNVPVRYFSAPTKSCFIEFEPPEKRQASSFTTYAQGRDKICEGCFVQEIKFDKLPPMSVEARESLELDPNAPARLIYISFAASPVVRGNTQIANNESRVAEDSVDFLTFYVQDENEELGSLIARHTNFHAMRNSQSRGMSSAAFDEFKQNYSKNLMHLVKVFFYLNVEKRQQIKISEASDLEKRISGVAEKKQRKLIQQLNRVYDRIVVGPTIYTPLDQRLSSGELPKGTKRPHFRRGYFGVRWVGTGLLKHAELVKVKETMVNEHMISGSGVAPKDYEIR